MNTVTNAREDLVNREYKYGFVTEIETDTVPRGLNKEIVRVMSAKKNEPNFMLDWRLKAYRHWEKLKKAEAEPKWANVHYPPIDYQDLIYYSAPKTNAGLNSIDEVDPKLLDLTFVATQRDAGGCFWLPVASVSWSEGESAWSVLKVVPKTALFVQPRLRIPQFRWVGVLFGTA